MQVIESGPWKVAENSNSLGHLDAPVAIVEFTDYECPYCKKFHARTFVELTKAYVETGKVRWISRDLPLDIHPYALKAAQAARCAGEQGKFWEMRDALLLNEAPPNDDVVKQSAETIKLDSTNFQTCLESDKFTSEVQKDATDAAELRINETPTFVVARNTSDKINGIVIIGAQPLNVFQSAIDDLLKK